MNIDTIKNMDNVSMYRSVKILPTLASLRIALLNSFGLFLDKEKEDEMTTNRMDTMVMLIAQSKR